MPVLRKVVVSALSFLVCPLESWSQTGPIRVPREGEGYTITRTNTRNDPAPEGYAGRTEAETLTAVGNTPATNGKTIVARFMLANKIKICPAADGRSEGTGVFTMSLDYTDQQPGGTSRLRIEMHTNATYKGQVDDQAWLTNPVQAEIDYTYTVSGSMRDPSGALATPAGSSSAQRITIPFTVGRGMSAPTVGAFSGGDPTAGRYAQAAGAGTALAYWAGIYYSEAQTKWRDSGRCVSTVFTPASKTTRLVPGGQSTVKGELRTRTGDVVKAHFLNARPIASGNAAAVSGAAVTPTEGSSDAGAPINFTFTAPAQKVDDTGFRVDAVSRAGIAEGARWIAGLGRDWSGSISVVITNTGDAGGDELLTWSNSSATQITVDLEDGKGVARGHTEVHELGVRRQRALRGGAVTIIFDSSDASDGTLDDEAPATVAVSYPNSGTYAIQLRATFKKEGTRHTQSCSRNTGCQHSVHQLHLPATLPDMTGQLDDPNRLRGSKTETRSRLGRAGTGTMTTTVSWDLARQGTGK